MIWILCYPMLWKKTGSCFPRNINLSSGFWLNLIFWNNHGKLELEAGERVYCCFSWHTLFRDEIGVLSSHAQGWKSCQATQPEGIFLAGYIHRNCTCDGVKGGFAHGCSVRHNPLSVINLPQPLARRGFWFEVNSNQNIQLEIDFKYT